jgi:hypothetical protein
MMRRIGVATVVVALGASGLVASSVTTASAAKPKVTAVGSVTCGSPGSGKAKIKPAFSLVAQAGQRVTTSKFKTTCTGTTGNAAVTPLSAKIKSTSTSSAASTCLDLQAGGETATTTVVNIKWKASGGKILPTTIVFTSILGGTPANGFTNPGPTGDAIVTGSYAGNDAVSQVIISNSVADLTAACLSKKGLKKLAFGSGGSLVLTP